MAASACPPLSCWRFAYFALKLIFGVDLLEMFTGGSGLPPSQQQQTEYQIPGGTTDVSNPGQTGGGVSANDVTTDAGKEFVARVLGSTERIWHGIFRTWEGSIRNPTRPLFRFRAVACGMAQSAMGPFYCPRDQKVYIDLSFYQDMKNKLGAPGDFAQAYVIAHEVGHHIQNILGIADKVMASACGFLKRRPMHFPCAWNSRRIV